MIWGIIGALDKEVELIRDSIAIEKTETVYGSTWYVGAYGTHKLVVACSGIGKINAALCTAAMIREFGAQVIVNVGVAGCMTKELGVLDVVISKSVVFHDQDQALFSRFYPHQKEFMADTGLLNACISLLDGKNDRGFKYRTGRIATGDVFVNDKSVKADIAARLDPLCVEMEGAAIGEAAFMHDTPFLVIRTMSDSADDSADESFDNFIELAAKTSAEIVLGLISAYPKK
jgi:adenosylhomocysteine nucleosidase